MSPHSGPMIGWYFKTGILTMQHLQDAWEIPRQTSELKSIFRSDCDAATIKLGTSNILLSQTIGAARIGKNGSI